MIEATARRDELYRLLGDLPPRSRPLGVEVVAREERRSYLLEKLVLDLNGAEPVPAVFVRPLEAPGAPPAVLYNHAHCADYVLGKDELVHGREILQQPPYAEVLTKLGYAALCIDAWAFGERRARTEGELFREMLWNGQVLWGMMVYDSLRGLDYLCSRDDVDTTRLATLGMSMGSTMAWWLAALDERIKVCVDVCCLTDFDALLAARALESHGLYYYVPTLRKHFSAAQINALIAPRAHLSLAGIYDPLTPPDGLDRIDAELRRVYAHAGAPDRWRLSRHAVGHVETAAMRAEIVAFLESELRPVTPR
jgi:dienelactone hydrolase